MFASILSAISGFLKILGIVAGVIQENRDQQVGAELQKGADAQAVLKQAQNAVAARDSVVPLDPSGLMPDGTTDIFDLDHKPGLPKP